MKKNTILAIVVLVCLLFPARQLFAGIDADLNGSIKTDNRVRFDTGEFTWNDNRVMLKIQGSPSDEYHYFSEVELKGLRTSADDELDWEVDVREAYLDLYQFLSDKLDLRIGRQIIAWGTGDQLNPTSNVCPDDLEDIFDFGKKLGTNAFSASLYLGDITFTGIFVPEFEPARLPAGDLADAFSPTLEPPEGMVFRNMTQHKIPPEKTLDESSQYALKVSTLLWEYDVSLSYFYGRDDLPLAGSITMIPVDEEGAIDLDIDLIYPRIPAIGADFAGAIGSVGIWGEGALFFPEKVEMSTYIQSSENVQLQQTTVVLDDEPYFKFVLGSDYTFTNGIYLDFQYLHGFIHERGSDELNDYFAFHVEKGFLNDELIVTPFGGALAITDWDDAGKNYGFVANPELSYYPVDNIELILGAYILAGEGENMFSRMKDQDQIYFKAKVSF